VQIHYGFERHTSCSLGISRWRLALCGTNRPTQHSWRNTCISIKNSVCVRSKKSSTLFPCVNWVSFEKNTSCLLGASRWRKAVFAPTRPIQLRWKTHVSLQREPSILEAGESSTLFPCEISVCFWKEYFFNLVASSYKQDIFVLNSPIELSWKTHVSL
jgi:hypothetical protein